MKAPVIERHEVITGADIFRFILGGFFAGFTACLLAYPYLQTLKGFT